MGAPPQGFGSSHLRWVTNDGHPNREIPQRERSKLSARSWLLLIHQIPARPIYLRARIRTRLDRAGAIEVKGSVYALPEREGARERLDPIAAEIRRGGGDAFVCEA